MAETFKIEGADAIIRRMKSLDTKMQGKIVVKGAREGAKEFQRSARENAKRFDDPATAEKLWKAIKVKKAKRSDLKAGNYDAGMIVYVKGNEYYYWYFLEFGTSKMRAQPFMRPAFDENWKIALRTTTKTIDVQLDKAVAEMR